MSLTLPLWSQQSTPSTKGNVDLSVAETNLPPAAGATGVDGIMPGNGSAPAGYRAANAPDDFHQFVFAPIPIESETFGFAIAPLAAYIFSPDPDDKKSQPSTLAVVGFISTNKSWAGGAGGSLNLKQDRYRTTFFLGYGQLRYDVFGAGTSAGNDGKSIEVHQQAYGVFGQQLFEIWSGFYLGPRFIWGRADSSFDLSDVLPESLKPFVSTDFNIPVTTVSLGFNVQHDKRDAIFYPTRGHFLQFTADYHSTALGSDRPYNQYLVGYNQYISFGNRNVLALRAAGCGVTGDHIPFFAYCQFGQQGDNRGYQSGRYRDLAMFATQAEWRSLLWKRFGWTAFAGVGEVAPDGLSFNFSNLLPSGGLGLRFNVLKEGRLNLRVDFAESKTGFSWTMGVGEVF